MEEVLLWQVVWMFVYAVNSYLLLLTEKKKVWCREGNGQSVRAVMQAELPGCAYHQEKMLGLDVSVHPCALSWEKLLSGCHEWEGTA